MEKPSTPLFWLDMEMSGLDFRTQFILEVALIVTDEKLNVLETYESVVYQPEEVIVNMDPWCKSQHAKTGLVDKIPLGKPLEEVEAELLKILAKYIKEKAILAGNSIHQDRKFIDRWMPNLAEKLHYRMCDVSSFKIVFETMYNQKFKKLNKHRAIDDIIESIDELKFYLSFIRI